MIQPAILLRDVSKSFPGAGARRTPAPGRLEAASPCEVLRKVNLAVAPGTALGLLGANGAGKTTLLEILATLLLPTSGHVSIQGRDAVHEAAAVRKLVGHCPAGFDSFYPRLTGTANVEFFAALHGFSPRCATQRVESLFERLGVDGGRDLDFQRHSTGMKQKLVLARALLTDPPILLLDEPTKSLDPRAQREIWRLLTTTLLMDLKKTVLLVTHSLAEAQEVCHRVVLLHEGGIVDVGSPASLTPSRLAKLIGEAPTELEA